MNTFNRAQGMDNQKLGQFTSEIKCAHLFAVSILQYFSCFLFWHGIHTLNRSNEMNYIKAHPFSAVNLGAGSEVRPPLSRIKEPSIYSFLARHSLACV
jgi:hypothetical protein